MTNVACKELEKVWLEKRERLTYTLMTAAGACIGYAMAQVNNLHPDWIHIVLLFALVSWGASFWFGYKKVIAEIESMKGQISIEYTVSVASTCEGVSLNKRMEDHMQTISDAMHVFEKSANRQVLGLTLGVALYGLWKTLSMFF